MGQAASDDLVHAGKVIGPLHRLDAVAAVLLVCADAVHHDHLAGHGQRPLGVGDVVALDAPGQRGQV